MHVLDVYTHHYRKSIVVLNSNGESNMVCIKDPKPKDVFAKPRMSPFIVEGA